MSQEKENLAGRNIASLQVIAEREVYHQHLINTLRLARAIYNHPETFEGTRVYFCVPLGLISRGTGTITHKKKILKYVNIAGGHICAPTFIDAPLYAQEHLEEAAFAINSEFQEEVLIEDDHLPRTYFVNPLKKGYKGLNEGTRYPRLDTFYSETKINDSQFFSRPIPQLRNTDYFVENTHWYKTITNALEYWR